MAKDKKDDKEKNADDSDEQNSEEVLFCILYNHPKNKVEITSNRFEIWNLVCHQERLKSHINSSNIFRYI